MHFSRNIRYLTNNRVVLPKASNVVESPQDHMEPPQPPEPKKEQAPSENRQPKLTKLEQRVLEDLRKKPKEEWTEFEKRVLLGIKKKGVDISELEANGNR